MKLKREDQMIYNEVCKKSSPFLGLGMVHETKTQWGWGQGNENAY